MIIGFRNNGMINRTMKQPELKHLKQVFKKYSEIKAVYLF